MLGAHRIQIKTNNNFSWVIIVMLITLSLNCNHKIDNEATSELEYIFLQKENKINPKLKGIWKSPDEGYLWDASGDSLNIYSFTENFCHREALYYLEHLLNSTAQFIAHGTDSIRFYYHDFGDNTADLQLRRDMVKIDKMPDHCLSSKELQTAKPQYVFQLFLETLQENYAFSQERHMDWQAIRNAYSNRVTEETTEEELFQLMGEIVVKTKDQHTKIIDPNGQRIQYSFTPSAQFVLDAFNDQTEIKDLGTYYNVFFNTQYKNITDSLLQGKGQKVANGQIEWGSLNEQIGYINIHSFAGFVTESLPRSKHIAIINDEMTNIIEAFQEKDALVVDISFNFGGFDAAGLTIASYFTDKEMLVYTGQTYHRGSFNEGTKQTIIPSKTIQFTKPVYLLMTDISRSAAETFAMQLKVLPNVHLVGINTLGTQSGMLNKAIGKFNLALSNQRFLTPDNQIYEVTGVPPRIKIPIFSDRKDIFNAHKEAVLELVGLIENESNK